MVACLQGVVTEAMRMTLAPSVVGQVVTVRLSPVPDAASRARASAKFNVVVVLPWIVGDFAAGVLLVDGRGYPVEWAISDLALWMVKGLAGDSYAVTVEILGAQALPSRWTAARVASSVAKVGGVSVAGMDAAAAAKVASVSAWVPSARKTAVVDAAARMVEASALLAMVQGWQAVAIAATPP